MTDPFTIGPEGAPSLAVDIQPDDLLGVFVLDESELGGPDVLGWGVADTWVNVVCDVLQVQTRQGVATLAGALTQAEAGTASVVVSDTLHQLDPLMNGDTVHRGTLFRLRAWGFDTAGDPWEETLFTATVDNLAAQYLPEEPPLVSLTAVDLIAELNGWESEGRAEPGVGAGDTLLGRVNRVLTEMGRSTTLVNTTDSDSVYAATLNPSTLAQPWQNILDAQEAELGRVWVDRDNRLVLRGRHSELDGPVRGTLSDVHGEAPTEPHCCVQSAAVVYGGEQMANVALGSRRQLSGVPDVATTRREDAWSVSRYGQVTVDRATRLELQLDAQVADWAEAVVLHGSRPELRVDRVQPQPSPEDLDSALDAWPAVMGTRIGDRWLFQYHPADGVPVERTLGVVGVAMTLTPEAFTVEWVTVDAPTPGLGGMGWFVLDVSELGSGDLLAPYSQPLSA